MSKIIVQKFITKSYITLKGVGLVFLSVSLVMGENLPQHMQVIHGNLNAQQAGPHMQITQSSQYGIINWNSFNVGSGHSVHFANGSGATLNRVTGLGASHINGSLSATGSLFLLNKNGVIIGAGGQVLTGGDFVASTLDISDSDFLNGGGFTLFGDSPYDVTNLGEISSSGGNILLAGYTVKNSGEITAEKGRVGLAAGTQIDVLIDTDWLYGAYAVKVGERGNDVTNEGKIESMVAELRTHNGNIYALAGNNEGMIHATGVEHKGGKVFLTAENGLVQSSGTIKAETSEGAGGKIEIEAAVVENYGGTQDVSGTDGDGGRITITTEQLISDTYMIADSDSGNAGDIIIDAQSEILLTSAGKLSAVGVKSGGQVALNANGGRLLFSADIDVSSATQGGDVALLGNKVSLLGGSIVADGDLGGGSIYLGGGYQGQSIWDVIDAPFAYSSSQETYISETTLLNADALLNGDGGQVIAWSDGTTQFAGTINARGGVDGGNGGLVETSGLAGLGVEGTVNAQARSESGNNGEWLLDPKNIIIDDVTDAQTQFQTIVQDPSTYATFDIDRELDSSGEGMNFGSAVDIDGDTVIIGAGNLDSTNLQPQIGAAYIFESGSIAARLSPSSLSTLASGFGSKVHVDGDYAFVVDNVTDNGVLYSFYKGGGWQNGLNSQLSRFANTDDSLFDGINLFGATLDSDIDALGDIVYVGSPGYDYTSVGSSVANTGIVYGIDIDTGQIIERNYAPTAYRVADTGYGSSLAVTEDIMYVGFTQKSLASSLSIDGSSVNINTTVVTNFSGNQEAVAYDSILSQAGFGIGRSGGVEMVDLFVAEDNLTNVANVLGIKTELGFVLSQYHSWNNDGIYTPIAHSEFTVTSGSGLEYLDLDISGDYIAVSYAALGGTGIVGVDKFNSSGSLISSGAWNPANEFTGGSSFGTSIALDGNNLLVGDPLEGSGVGSATLITKDANTNWSDNGLAVDTAVIRAQFIDDTHEFGYGGVVVDGNTVVVADAQFGITSPLINQRQGAIFVYEDDSLAAVVNNVFVNYELGTDIDFSGDTIISIEDGTNDAYIFERGAGWQNGNANLVEHIDGGLLTYDGVAIDGETIALSYNENNNSFIRLLENTGNDWSSATSTVVATGLTSTPYLMRHTLDLEGDTIVGVYSADTRSVGNTDERQTVVWENTSDDWTNSTRSILVNPFAAQEAASTLYYTQADVSLSGDTIAVSGHHNSLNGNLNEVFIYERSTDWSSAVDPTARITNPDDNTEFGGRVALDGDNLAISNDDEILFYKKQSGWQNGATNLIGSLDLSNSGFENYFSGRHSLVPMELYGSELILVSTENQVLLYDIDTQYTFGSHVDLTQTIAPDSLTRSLDLGTNITLQANNDITVNKAIMVDNQNGDGGDLTLEAGRNILVNDHITTDNGDLTLIANASGANQSYRDSADSAVVIGRNASNESVKLNLGTGDLLINAGDSFENRSGSPSPFKFDAINSGSFLIYATSPDHSLAFEANNVGADLAIIGRDFVQYGVSFDEANYRPSTLPTGSGFVYSVLPSLTLTPQALTVAFNDPIAPSFDVSAVTVAGAAVDAATFGITEQEIEKSYEVSIDASLPTSSVTGTVNAGTYTGAIAVEAKSAPANASLFGLGVTLTAAADLVVNPVNLDADAITVTGVLAQDREYNGLLDVVLNGGVLSQVINGLSLNSDNVSGTMLDADFGLDKAVTVSGFLLEGADAPNYRLTQPTDVTVDIAKKKLDITGVQVADKLFDGNTSATLSGGTLQGVVVGEDVGLVSTNAAAEFEDSAVGTDKVVNLLGFNLTGADISNYEIDPDLSATGSILPVFEEIDEVIPSEVLRADSNKELEEQRASLQLMAEKAPDVFILEDFEARNELVNSGIVVVAPVQAILQIPLEQQDDVTKQYIAATNAAKQATQYAQGKAAEYRVQARLNKESGYELNLVMRQLSVEQGLIQTYQTQIESYQGQIDVVQENLRKVEVAKQTLATYEQRIEEAARGGRGSEVEAYKKIVAEAELVASTEGELLEQLNSLNKEKELTEKELEMKENTIVALQEKSEELEETFNESKEAALAAEKAAGEGKALAQKAAEEFEEAKQAGIEKYANIAENFEELKVQAEKQKAELTKIAQSDTAAKVAAKLVEEDPTVNLYKEQAEKDTQKVNSIASTIEENFSPATETYAKSLADKVAQGGLLDTPTQMRDNLVSTVPELAQLNTEITAQEQQAQAEFDSILDSIAPAIKEGDDLNMGLNGLTIKATKEMVEAAAQQREQAMNNLNNRIMELLGANLDLSKVPTTNANGETLSNEERLSIAMVNNQLEAMKNSSPDDVANGFTDGYIDRINGAVANEFGFSAEQALNDPTVVIDEAIDRIPLTDGSFDKDQMVENLKDGTAAYVRLSGLAKDAAIKEAAEQDPTGTLKVYTDAEEAAREEFEKAYGAQPEELFIQNAQARIDAYAAVESPEDLMKLYIDDSPAGAVMNQLDLGSATDALERISNGENPLDVLQSMASNGEESANVQAVKAARTARAAEAAAISAAEEADKTGAFKAYNAINGAAGEEFAKVFGGSPEELAFEALEDPAAAIGRAKDLASDFVSSPTAALDAAGEGLNLAKNMGLATMNEAKAQLDKVAAQLGGLGEAMTFITDHGITAITEVADVMQDFANVITFGLAPKSGPSEADVEAAIEVAKQRQAYNNAKAAHQRDQQLVAYIQKVQQLSQKKMQLATGVMNAKQQVGALVMATQQQQKTQTYYDTAKQTTQETLTKITQEALNEKVNEAQDKLVSFSTNESELRETANLWNQ